MPVLLLYFLVIPNPGCTKFTDNIFPIFPDFSQRVKLEKNVDFVEVDRQGEIAEQKAEKFAAKLRELGIDPEAL